MRRVERPPYEQLIAELQASSFLAVGRKYGVSDNAIRKWLRAYERERADEGGEAVVGPASHPGSPVDQLIGRARHRGCASEHW
jgi:transposase-like protein